MNSNNHWTGGLKKRRLELTLALAAILITLSVIGGGLVSAAAPQEARPRRSNAIAPPCNANSDRDATHNSKRNSDEYASHHQCDAATRVNRNAAPESQSYSLRSHRSAIG